MTSLRPVVIVTGGNGLIGRAIAKRFVLANYEVICLDLPGALTEVVEDPELSRVHWWPVDINSEGSLEEMVFQLGKQFGRVDCLVNNAAIDTKVSTASSLAPADPISQLLAYPLDELEKTFRTNLFAPLRITQILAPMLRESSNATVINISSVYGLLSPDHRIYRNANIATFKGPDYPTSKAALLSLTRYLAVTLAPWGIRVNAISPGGVVAAQTAEFIASYSATVPLERMADADEVAAVVEFLGSEDSSYITGENIVLDGGKSVW